MDAQTRSGKTLTPDAFKTIESIAKDQEELKIFRVYACIALSYTAAMEGLINLSANYDRSVIDLVEESCKSNQTLPNRTFVERDLFYDFGIDGVRGIPTKIGDHIDYAGEKAKKHLHWLENVGEDIFWRSSHDEEYVSNGRRQHC